MGHGRRAHVLLIAAFGVTVLLGFRAVETAQAERCSPDGRICLLTDASLDHPYQPPQQVQVAVDSAADYVIVKDAWNSFGGEAERVSQGAPGGISIWQVPLRPIEADSTITLEVYARVGDPAGFNYSFTATFPNLPVLGTVLFGDSRIRRAGGQYLATFDYTARRPVTIEQQLWLTTQEPYTSRVTTQTTETGVGAGTVTMRLDVEAAKRFLPAASALLLGHDLHRLR